MTCTSSGSRSVVRMVNAGLLPSTSLSLPLNICSTDTPGRVLARRATSARFSSSVLPSGALARVATAFAPSA